MLEQRNTTQNQQNWLAKLLGYEFDIIYKVGAGNKVADALSRKDEDKELQVLSKPFWQEVTAIDDEVLADPVLSKIKKDLEQRSKYTPSTYYRTQSTILQRKTGVVCNLGLDSQIVTGISFIPNRGHSGSYRTYRRIAQSVYWIGMKGAITDFVASCHICQRSKYQASSPAGLLQPLPIPNAIWEDISMDFVVGLPKAKGYDDVLVVVDRLSKYGHFILIKHPYSASSIAEVSVKEIVRLHGIPTSIVSDRDTTFLSHFWQELFRL